jgi:hypothetical protein
MEFYSAIIEMLMSWVEHPVEWWATHQQPETYAGESKGNGKNRNGKATHSSRPLKYKQMEIDWGANFREEQVNIWKTKISSEMRDFGRRKCPEPVWYLNPPMWWGGMMTIYCILLKLCAKIVVFTKKSSWRETNSLNLWSESSKKWHRKLRGHFQYLIFLRIMRKKELTLLPAMLLKALNWSAIEKTCDARVKEEYPEIWANLRLEASANKCT